VTTRGPGPSGAPATGTGEAVHARRARAGPGSLLGVLMIKLDGAIWTVFTLWSVAGLLAYFAYGRRHSRLAHAGVSQGRQLP
jgi:C-terminus of AA_permease